MRYVHELSPSLYRMDQVVQVNGKSDGFDAQGGYWCFGLIHLAKGTLEFIADGRPIPAPSKQFAMAMPPQSLVQVRLSNAKTFNSALFSQTKPPKGFPHRAIAFPLEVEHLPESTHEVSEILLRRSHEVSIERCLNPHVLSEKAKKTLEADFRNNAKLEVLSKRLRTSGPMLSRTFKKDFGMTPIQFRSWLRVMESMKQLMEAEAIIDVAHDVGFNDLSRFYKMFQKILGISPGKLISKKVKKRQD